MQGICKTLFSLMIVCALFAATTGNVRGAVELPAGQEVEVVFSQDISSSYLAPGDLVPIRLSKPIVIGGFTVVKEGTGGSARVKSVTPAGRGGKPGSVTIELLELEPGSSYEAEDDKKIMLKAVGEITASGKSKKLLSWIFILGLFIKGGQGEIPADQPIKAVIAEDIVILMD